MPTLDFKGKQFIHSHHLSVPFRELRVNAKKSLPKKGGKPGLEDNLVIHGDNLEALKALLPTHAGKVDCIFIDPPYNTGNEGWCYNDNVRSPLMKEWLKKEANPVDKEDLERHDKWLCMMWPRLQLLHELLSEEGAIIVTLDDNEVHRLREMMDEIFGLDNFIANCLWQKNYSPKNTAEFFSSDHDHVLIYAKRKSSLEIGALDRTAEQEGRYKNPDADKRGVWKTSDLSARNPYSEGTYGMKCPSGRVIDGPPKGRWWTIAESKFHEYDEDNRIWWGVSGNSIPQLKRFLTEIRDGRVPQTLWFYGEVGHTDGAKKELNEVMSYNSSGDVFITPKPTSLLERVLKIFTNENSLILDSFAGSGTTAHAVLKANAKDGGNRRFILVECEDYADTLTAERVRRVIQGYAFTGTQKEELMSEKVTLTKLKKAAEMMEKAESIANTEGTNFDRVKKTVKDGVFKLIGERDVKEKTPGLGGSFTYCELGDPIDVGGLLSGKDMPDFATLARYVFYTATGNTLDKVAKASADGFIGETELYRVHLFYKADKDWLRGNEAALDEERIEAIVKSRGKSGKRSIVFAVSKFMSQKELSKQSIEFCQLPYAIHRIFG